MSTLPKHAWLHHDPMEGEADELKGFLSQCSAILVRSYERGAVPRDLLELIEGILQVRETWLAFHNSSRRKVEGKDGVAAYLGVSKSMVHVRLQKWGLTTDDFRDPQSRPAKLVRKSSRLAPLWGKYYQ